MSWFARMVGWWPAVPNTTAPPAISAAAIVSQLEAVPTAALLEKLVWAKPEMWASVLAPACERHGIVTRLRLAAFLANTGHETGGGSTLVESLNYSAEALIDKFGRHRITIEQASRLGRTASHPAQQEALANQLYGGEWGRKNLGNTEPGDGWRFRGPGLVQLTGRANYQRFAVTNGVPLNDALLASLEVPLTAAESAAHFWRVADGNIISDTGDIAAVRRRVNGGDSGLSAVRARFSAAMAALSREQVISPSSA